MSIIFIIFVFFSFFSYLIYPGLLCVLSKFLSNPWSKEDIAPLVSVIISAYNEEQVIEEKVNNTLALEYPGELLEVIVVSDGSTDRTNDIVSGIHDVRVVLRAFSERLGKTACLNRVVPKVNGDIVVFTDANSMFPPDLLKKMVKNFTSPEIGLVTGWTKYRSISGKEETSGIYSTLEKWTKSWESLISSCVGADGAAFAIRKSLYRTLEVHDINDFVIPLHIIDQGKRAVMDPEVFCYEESSEQAEKEYRRQVRITTRTLGAIRRNTKFLNPLRFGSFSFFLVSHKVLRFSVPFFLMGLFISNLLLLGGSPIYLLTFAGQVFFLVTGLIGILNLYNGRLVNFIKFFLIITLSAQLIGWFRMIIGVSDTMWTPQR